MVISEKGLKFINQWEGSRLTAYQDQRGIWTIGVGHTGPDVTCGLTVTQEMVDSWLRTDTRAACQAIARNIDVALSQNQFDAIASFVYNVGVSAAVGSTLFKYVNRGLTDLAAAEFGKWNHVSGVVDAGLTRRRAAERDLFLSMD